MENTIIQRKHLEDFLKISKENEVNVEELIDEYTMLAIKYSINDFKPTNTDYLMAYQTIIEKYNGK